MIKTLVKTLFQKLPIAAQSFSLLRGAPDWRSGYAQFGKKAPVVISWSSFPCGLGATLRFSNKSRRPEPSAVEAHLGDGPARSGNVVVNLNLLMLHMSMSANLPAALSHWPKEPREIAAGIMESGWCYLRAWSSPDAQTSSNLKDWRRFGSDIRDIVFGRERITDHPKEREPARVLALRMPDGKQAYCQVATKTVLVSRPRWPWLEQRRYFNVKTGQQGYDQGLYDGTFRANSWTEAFGILHEGIAKKRGLGEVQAGKLPLDRCPLCRGIGATLDKSRSYCEACKGTGAASAVEFLRQLTISGEIARDITLLEQLAQLAQNADWLTQARTLYSAAVLALRENRPGLAAKYAGMALACIYGNGPEQQELTQLCRALLGWIPRLQHEIPREAWEMKFTTLLQALPDGGLLVLPNWRPEAFAEMLPQEVASSEQFLSVLRELQRVLDETSFELQRAGMPEKDSPLLYIRSIQNERAQLQDHLFAAKKLFAELVRIGIPEGIAGERFKMVLEGVRELFSKMKEPLPVLAS